MTAVNSVAIAGILAARLGLGFSGSSEEVEGGSFAVIRPSDLPRPNGFGVLVARTPKLMEASFRADNFAKALIRKMSEADSEARTVFAAVAAGAIADGFRVIIAINGDAVSPFHLPTVEWNRIEIDCDRRLPASRLTEAQVNEAAVDVASTCLSLVLTLLETEEVEASEQSGFGLPEGAKRRVEVNRYERSPANRAACIAHYGPVCQVCCFDFRTSYGEIASGYIEVHHLTPVSQMGGEYRINPIADLIPVCANCHAVLHRTDPPMKIDALRALVAERRSPPRSPETLCS